MALDPRQVVAAFLTLSMFAMLGNMIKRDHFDSIEVRLPESTTVQVGVIKIEEHTVVTLPKVSKGPWMNNEQVLKPCWAKPSLKEADESKGFVTFSLTSSPEYHASQVADAVVVARYLGATLVLPDIRGTELGQKRNFKDMYDVERFTRSLDGVLRIIEELPANLATGKPAVVKVPSRVSEEFIVKNIKPIFETKSYLRLAISFLSTSTRAKEKKNKDLDSTACLALFGSLELKPDIRQVADVMVERLKTLSRKYDGHFIAVDLRVDALEKKSCTESVGKGRKSCYSAQEVGDFLKKIGFDGDTVIYLTQTWWHESLDAFKAIFPKTYTKDDVIPAEKKGNILRSKSGELERALDLEICSQSDAFVPAISGPFYENVAGRRIASGKTLILDPAHVTGFSASASDFISSFVSKKNHFVNSCYC